jgi:toxin FitB
VTPPDSAYPIVKVTKSLIRWGQADWGSPCRAETHSAATIGEIQSGIEITREHDRSKAAEIEVWLKQVSETYNVLSIDARIFRCWARFIHRRFDRLIEDVMIAATVMVHNLTVVTRNVRDFEHFEVHTLNPFDTAAG